LLIKTFYSYFMNYFLILVLYLHFCKQIIKIKNIVFFYLMQLFFNVYFFGGLWCFPYCSYWDPNVFFRVFSAFCTYFYNLNSFLRFYKYCIKCTALIIILAFITIWMWYFFNYGYNRKLYYNIKATKTKPDILNGLTLV